MKARIKVTLFTVVVSLGTLAITVLGDGLADVPKQGHLIFNMSLAWFVGACVFAAQRLGTLLRRR